MVFFKHYTSPNTLTYTIGLNVQSTTGQTRQEVGQRQLDVALVVMGGHVGGVDGGAACVCADWRFQG